ncbi:MAG: hypothetical protein KG075_10375 [Alphaproteobacteria bacterium]|nr:hypothetical protein [Alphaproteobacteria bacterium]
MLKIVGVAMAGLLMVAQPTSAQPKWAQGQTYSGNIDIGGVQVPLLSGDWIVTGVEQIVLNNAGSGGQTNVALAQLSDGKLRAYMMLSYNQQALSRGWNVTDSKNCLRNEIHYAVVISDMQLAKSCSYVNHAVFTIAANSAKWWKDTVDYAKRHNIAVPLTAILSGTVVSDRANFVSVAYYFNPEAKGFPGPINTAWQTSDWSALNVASNEQKKSYIQSIIEWTNSTRSVVEAGLAGKLKKGESLDWPTAMQ